jgi:hypothetical protein
MYIDVPIGEVFDRLSIAMIKYEKTTDKAAGQYITDLKPLVSQYMNIPQVAIEFGQLVEINRHLWFLESYIRWLIHSDEHIDERVNSINAMAERITVFNDKRCKVKNKLTLSCGGEVTERKVYEKDKRPRGNGRDIQFDYTPSPYAGDPRM